MRFLEVDEHSLHDAEPGITLVEKLLGEDFKFYLLGTTTKQDVLLAAQDAIDADSDSEASATLTEIAVCVPFSSDYLSYLTGSGLALGDAEFAYESGGGEGTRSLNFKLSRRSPKITANEFEKMALADSDLWIDDFLFQYGTGKASQIVNRNEPATHHHHAKNLSSIDEFLAR